jgi:hypothetical protein
VVKRLIVRPKEFLNEDCEQLAQAIDKGYKVIDKIEVLERGTVRVIHYILKN